MSFKSRVQGFALKHLAGALIADKAHKEGYSGTPDVMRILFHLTARQHKRMACPRKD
jgi:hypothetical protein